MGPPLLELDNLIPAAETGQVALPPPLKSSATRIQFQMTRSPNARAWGPVREPWLCELEVGRAPHLCEWGWGGVSGCVSWARPGSLAPGSWALHGAEILSPESRPLSKCSFYFPFIFRKFLNFLLTLLGDTG